MTGGDAVDVSATAVLTFTLIAGGWVAAIICLVDAIRRRARGNETAGTWVVFLATSLIVVPFAGALALAYVVFVVYPGRHQHEGPVHEGVGTVAALSARVWASLIDWALLGLPIAVLIWNVSEIDLSARVFDTPGWAMWLGWSTAMLYQVSSVALWGKTLGKHLLAIEVVDAGLGARPSWSAAALRAAPALLGLVPYLGSLMIFTYLPLLWREDRRGFHDLLAGTIVVSGTRRHAVARGPAAAA